MRICLILLLLPVIGYSQNNFEGTIRYQGFDSFDKDTIFAEAIYGKTKLKFSSWKIVNHKRVDEPTYKIYDLDSGIYYEINSAEKSCLVDSLKRGVQEDVMNRTTDTQSIVGYHCVKYVTAQPVDTSEGYVEGDDISFWYTDEIRYVTPALFRNNQIFIGSVEGNILWLKMQLKLTTTAYNNGQPSPATNSIFFSAIAIMPGIIDDSHFSIPSGYSKKFEKNAGSAVKISEIKVEIEKSEPPPPPPPRPAKKKPIKN